MASPSFFLLFFFLDDLRACFLRKGGNQEQTPVQLQGNSLLGIHYVGV